MKRAILTATALVFLAGCNPAPDASTANEALSEGAGDISQAPADQPDGLPIPPADTLAQSPDTAVASNDGEQATINEAEDNSENSPSTAIIPAQYRGRWGMVPADCEPGRSDAKGLVTIGDQTLRFYESVGTLQEQRPAIATSFAGVYGFTGEGQTWERVVVLRREGDQLFRTESDRTYTYTRCP